MKLSILLAGSLLAGLAFVSPATAQSTAGEPAFRVPLSSTDSIGSGSPIWAWMQVVSQCSSTCGSGTRNTDYACQNISDYDYSGAGYGPSEPDAQCIAGGAGDKPASASAACTDYSGCSYTWVRPAVVSTPVASGSNPPGRVGCGLVHTVYSPYCKRSDGTVLAGGDYKFCQSSSGYNVDPSNPDTLGYDRTTVQTDSCSTSDNAWQSGAWTGTVNTCEANNVQTRSVTCVRTFDGTVEADAQCTAAKPQASQIVANYSTCSYSWSSGAWSASSSTCSSSATQTRAETCMRSNDGGTPTSDADCTSRGIAKPAASQTVADYSTCTYSWSTGGWSASSSTCSGSATQSRSVSCIRSNGDAVGGSSCSGTQPASTQTVADYSGCSYSWQTGGWSASANTCSGSTTQTRSVWCQRSDGTQVGSGCAGAAPASSQTVSDYSGCSYSWQVGGWSGSSNTCSGSATQTRSVWCQRSDGATVSSGCAGAAPASSQTVADYSGCSYSAAYGAFSACTNGSQSRTVTCTRSDGAQVDPSYCGTGSTQTQSCTPPFTTGSNSNCTCKTGTVIQSWDSECGSPGNPGPCQTLGSQWSSTCQSEGGSCYCNGMSVGRKTDPNEESATCYR